MTIRRGEEWGTTGPLSSSAPVVRSDAELASLLDPAGARQAEVGLVGGDLARTVGARGTPEVLRTDPERTRLPVDVGVAVIDGEPVCFAAHLVIRRRWWTGPVTAVMNASFLGSWNASPRGHPNDGRLERIDADLDLADRLKARRRLRSGTHIPHPDIEVRRVTEGRIPVPSRSVVVVDGIVRGTADQVDFSVWPDAVTIVI